MKPQTTNEKRELADSAFYILNELMAEIHGARLAGIKAIKNLAIFQTK